MGLSLAVDNGAAATDIPTGAFQTADGASLDFLIGQSPAMKNVFRLVERVAASDSTIMITGETGTGKGLIARAIHALSPRALQPLVTINCGAIPENLLESELFGHVKGSFTGATRSKIGKFELARGGTLFLDEIGDMSADLQVKLLRVLEEGEFEPVGGSRTVKTDIRVIAATHRNLESAIAEGRFREDLFYRIYVIPIEMPALRDRKSDVPLLLNHFLDQCRRSNKGDLEGIDGDAMDILASHSWPGNIREMRNLVERLSVIKGHGRITAADIPASIRGGQPVQGALSVCIGEEGLCLNTAVTDFEKTLILQSLEKAHGVKNQAAKLLRLNRTTLVEKIKRHNL
ncbi:MAG: sigma-54 dependent transcriptional regulator [Pseudomonadota bacterium]